MFVLDYGLNHGGNPNNALLFIQRLQNICELNEVPTQHVAFKTQYAEPEGLATRAATFDQTQSWQTLLTKLYIEPDDLLRLLHESKRLGLSTSLSIFSPADFPVLKRCLSSGVLDIVKLPSTHFWNLYFIKQVCEIVQAYPQVQLALSAGAGELYGKTHYVEQLCAVLDLLSQYHISKHILFCDSMYTPETNFTTNEELLYRYLIFQNTVHRWHVHEEYKRSAKANHHVFMGLSDHQVYPAMNAIAMTLGFPMLERHGCNAEDTDAVDYKVSMLLPATEDCSIEAVLHRQRFEVAMTTICKLHVAGWQASAFYGLRPAPALTNPQYERAFAQTSTFNYKPPVYYTRSMLWLVATKTITPGETLTEHNCATKRINFAIEAERTGLSPKELVTKLFTSLPLTAGERCATTTIHKDQAIVRNVNV